jgi:hypothetical protein
MNSIFMENIGLINTDVDDKAMFTLVSAPVICRDELCWVLGDCLT